MTYQQSNNCEMYPDVSKVLAINEPDKDNGLQQDIENVRNVRNTGLDVENWQQQRWKKLGDHDSGYWEEERTSGSGSK